MNILARYVHGSSDSVDCDVLYITDRLPTMQECAVFCSADRSENRNLAVVSDGVVSACYKGFPDEVNNAVAATYPLHVQRDALMILRAVPRDRELKYLSVLRKFIMELRHTALYDAAKKALKGTYLDRMQLARSADLRALRWEISLEDRLERIKSMAFQFGQALALRDGIEVYTKQAIGELLPELEKYLKRREAPLDDLEQAKRAFLDIMTALDIRDCGKNTVLLITEGGGHRCISLAGKEHDAQGPEGSA